MSDTRSATQFCEGVLNEIKSSNTAHSIWPSENLVIDAMLSRSLELKDAYEEVAMRVRQRPEWAKTFFDAILGVAILWNPDKICDARSSREELTEVNAQIAECAAMLAELFDQRSHLGNTSGFSTRTHYHVCDVLLAAGKSNSLFGSYVRDQLESVRTQFDLKYWPSLGDYLRVLAADAAGARAQAVDPLTAVATSAPRASFADFLKALYAAIEEVCGHGWNLLPPAFKLTDPTVASLVNGLLNLQEEEMVDAAYVKRFRQRSRQASSQPRGGEAGSEHLLDISRTRRA
jgi:hypothetical protein